MAKPKKSPTSEQTPQDEVPGLSTVPIVNLIVADIALRVGTNLLHKTVSQGLLGQKDNAKSAADLTDKKGKLPKKVAASASKLATKSVPGAVAVGGALLVKNLFDRSQRRRVAARNANRKNLPKADEE